MSDQKQLIGIAGGIGTGKSMVSRLLRLRGYPVYDCDTEAKRLMSTDPEVHKALEQAFGAEVIADPRQLAEAVFGNSERLATLNGIVHPAVRKDLQRWAEKQASSLLFVESAILASSGIGESCRAVMAVETPLEQRIRNVQRRNGLPCQAIMDRIKAQETENKRLAELPIEHFAIHNTPARSLLSQAQTVVEYLKSNQQHSS